MGSFLADALRTSDEIPGDGDNASTNTREDDKAIADEKKEKVSSKKHEKNSSAVVQSATQSESAESKVNADEDLV